MSQALQPPDQLPRQPLGLLPALPVLPQLTDQLFCVLAGRGRGTLSGA